MSKTRRAFELISDTEFNREAFTAVSTDKTRSYPTYVERGGMLLVPKNKNEKAEMKMAPLKTPPFKLRDYQNQPVADAVKSLSNHSGLFLKAAPGMGKTCMALAISAINKYKKVIVLVDQKKLADQWAERISQFLPKATYKVFHSQATKIDNLRESKATFDLVVAQSLMTKDWVDDPVKCDLVICDEAHVFSAPRFCKSIYNLDYHHSLALTATEDRRDGLTWVFMQFLADKMIEVAGRTLTAKVIRPEVTTGVRYQDYQMAYCRFIQGMTWKAKCRDCEKFSKFPVRCGGGLPMNDLGVAWKEDIIWTPMLVDLFKDEKYMSWFAKMIIKMYKAGRQLLVFNQFREPLDRLREALEAEVNPKHIGIYTSKTKDSVTALECPITLTTYKMSQKGLDVPFKDSAVLMSPVSDIRQTVGRITRLKEGKRQPILVDPVIKNNPILFRQSKKRLKQYKELGFEV